MNKGRAADVALITGASHGIGKEVARQLAQLGMTVILTVRTRKKEESAAEDVSGGDLDVRPAALDVTERTSPGSPVG